MLVIDADTHVDETESTWEYMREDEFQFKPTTGYPAKSDPSRPSSRYWLIDGQRQIRFIRDDEKTRTTVETRELLDVSARLRAMDERGIHLQVIYPTLFIMEATTRPEVSVALRRSYNRWLADRCAQSKGRLRWVCLPPTMVIDEAIKEIKFGKDHGACGVLKKGDREAGRVHAFTAAHGSRFSHFAAPWVPNKFPKLRFGFIEANSSWVPYVIYDLKRRIEQVSAGSTVGKTDYVIQSELLKTNRMYVTCQSDEDLSYILKFSGEDNLIMGSDYTHNDQSMDHDFARLLPNRADNDDIPKSVVSKILYDNPKTFYAL